MLGNCVYRFEACGSAHCSLAPTGSLIPVKTMAESVLRTQLAQMACLATSPHGWEQLSQWGQHFWPVPPVKTTQRCWLGQRAESQARVKPPSENIPSGGKKPVLTLRNTCQHLETRWVSGGLPSAQPFIEHSVATVRRLSARPCTLSWCCRLQRGAAREECLVVGPRTLWLALERQHELLL